jgi:hypothetical protein
LLKNQNYQGTSEDTQKAVQLSRILINCCYAEFDRAAITFAEVGMVQAFYQRSIMSSEHLPPY